MRRFVHTVCVFIALLCLPVPALASRISSLNLEEMTDRADRIFMGRCVKVRVGVDRELGQTVTWVTFAPEHVAKGGLRGALTIKILGDRSVGTSKSDSGAGLPGFEEGEKIVLFLRPDSGAGLTSPVGFGQGAFRVTRDKAGIPEAVNAIGNERLLDRLSPAAQQKLGSQAARYKGQRAIPAAALLDLVEALRGEP